MIERDGRYAVRITNISGEHQVIHRSNNKAKAEEVVKVYDECGYDVELIDEEAL